MNIVFLDIEADSEQNKILQFGAIKFDNIKIYPISLFANPNCEISKYVFNLIKKNIEKIKNGFSQKEIAFKIKDYLKDSYFLSFGDFDFLFLKNFLKKEINYNLEQMYFIDVQNEWKKICSSKKGWSLENLAKYLKIKINPSNFHDALYDATILFKIFCKLNTLKKDNLKKIVCKKNISTEKIISIKNKKINTTSVIVDNTSKINGECFLEIDFKKIYTSPLSKEIITSIDILEIENNSIRRNWSFNYDYKKMNVEKYYDELYGYLKKCIQSIENKKIIINESNYGKYIKLINLCSELINIFPINKIIFCDGFENFYNQTCNNNYYEKEKNQNLIKNWLVYNLIKEEIL